MACKVTEGKKFRCPLQRPPPHQSTSLSVSIGCRSQIFPLDGSIVIPERKLAKLGFGIAAATAKSLQSCPTLCRTAHRVPPSLGFSRQVHWSGLPFPSPIKLVRSKQNTEGLMLKLKLQYFGHVMQRTDSLEETLMLGRIKGSRRRR